MRKLLFLCLLLAPLCYTHAQFSVNALRTSLTMSVDGNLSEAAWQNFTNVSKTIVGTPNNTGTSFAVTWNSTYLFVGMRVTDGNLFNESTNAWDDDAFEIYIDAENNGGTAYGTNDRQFVKEWNSTTIWEKNNRTTGVLHAWAAITGGYTLEVAIPWSNFGITAPAAGLTIGFDIANDDDDNGAARESQLMWSGDNDNWRYPRNFGDLVLQDVPDTQAPSAPTNLSVANLAQSSLTLNWTASTDNIAVTGYDVYRNGVKINTAPVTATTFNVTGLSAATAYQFYVNARDAAGNTSSNSNTVNVTTPDTQAPTAPSGLTASNIAQSSLTLTWSAATDNVAVTGYDVYQNGVKINAGPVPLTTFNVTGLTASTAYQFYITAGDAAGNTSVNSGAINVTTASIPDTEPPTAPSDLNASVVTQSSLTLNWTASTDNVGVTGYDVYQNSIKINTSPVTTTSFNVTGLAAVTTYSYFVQARDAAGNTSAPGNNLIVTTPDTQSPTAPAGLTSSNITASSVTLNWSAATDNVSVTGYDVYQNGIKINPLPVAQTTFNVTGLITATSYSFYVRALDGAGNISANSNTINITTLDNIIPSAPANLNATNVASTSLTLNWTAATDNVAVTGYDVYQNGTKLNSSPVASTTYNVTGLTASTAYQFYVNARDAATNISPNSNLLNVTTPAAPVACSGTGSINFQRWNNVTGSTVASLTSVAGYPNNPSTSGAFTSFEIPTNSGNNYGMRVWGYICPPVTGSYTFWIAADDNAELWLSTTSNSANRVRIAFHTGFTSSRQWNKYASQKSVAITLNSGQLYFIEALMKESSQGDNLAVGWARPGQSTTAPSEVIPGVQLRTSLPDTQSPTAPSNLSSSSITQNSFTLNWTASTDNVAVTGYDVFQNGIKINAVNITGTSFNVSGLTAATAYSYYVVARDAAGNLSPNSSILNVTTAAPDTQAPSIPTNLVASNIGLTTFILTWTASTDNTGVTGYDVYQNGVKINTSVIAVASFTINSLTPGTTYAFSVKARDAANNESDFSNVLNVTTALPVAGTETFTMRTILSNQRMPHDLVYGPDNNIWFIERFAGTVSFVNPVTRAETVVLTLGAAMARTGGQDGLFGLALHPQFNGGKPFVYIAYTYQSTSATVRKTRIVRYTYNSSTQQLGEPVTILENIPGSNDHNSGRLAIGPDLKLYYTVGDMGAGQFDNLSRTNFSQDLNVLEGKILRLNTELTDGTWIPADNPFANAGQPTPVYTFGHRNPQGLVWGNVNGTNILYSTEHGPYSDDEVNVIESGRNYGWPNVIGFCDNNYNGRTTGGFTIVNEQNNCAALNAKEPIRSLFPVAIPPAEGTNNSTWPSTAPSGTEFYGSTAIPGWQNSLLIAQLKRGAVTRLKLSNDGQNIISDTIHYFKGLGRFRDVIVSSDGLKIYVACDSSGSTSGPTGGVTSTPANPGSILEFTYQPPVGGRMNQHIITITEIPEEKKDRSVEVYPNPATGYFVIYNYNPEAGRTAELIDLNGRVVKRIITNGTATRVDTKGLLNGLYILRVTDISGKQISVEKLLIQQ
ncbi:fibronectin type III domain-containing protein [Lacibacter sp. MH-610]|uniref:fibronectin type III domain-containing protein n=1 Tax=Lacibacter sp. MH-610 TaxID=3020883 RepID=UPI003891A2B9